MLCSYVGSYVQMPRPTTVLGGGWCGSVNNMNTIELQYIYILISHRLKDGMKSVKMELSLSGTLILGNPNSRLFVFSR